MKVALVVPGGVDRSCEYRVIPALLALIKRLAAHHELHVFALQQEPEPGQWNLLGARVHNIGSHRTRSHAVRAILAEHKVAPFQVVHAIWSHTPGLVAVIAARLLKAPCLIHLAGGELVALRDIGYGGSLAWKGALREALVLRAANAVTAASTPLLELLESRGISASRVPLGVDLQAWPPRGPERREPHETARLIHVASLNRVKDQGTLLRALARLAESGLPFSMDIVGEDVLAGEVQVLAERLGLTAKVRFHGFLTQRQLRPLVEAAHLMLISSRFEAGPLAVLEAAAAGVPTVGTAVGHIAEWSPLAAHSVPVGDWRALADTITHLLGDEDLRLQTAQAAFTNATREDADFTARAFESIYGRLV